jgi:osmotically-inducible protein OsmY
MRASRHLAVLALGATLSAAGCTYFKCESGECTEDAGIRETVLKQIRARPSLSMFHIDVQTYKRDVYLYGMVDTELDRGRAEDIARAVPDVKHVYNALGLYGNGNL